MDVMKQPKNRPGSSRNRPVITLSRARLEREVRLLFDEGPDWQHVRLPDGFGIDYSKIDYGMRGIIRWLNANGFPTVYCCIGSQTLDQLRRDQHNPSGYIAFCRTLPTHIHARVSEVGLSISNYNSPEYS